MAGARLVGETSTSVMTEVRSLIHQRAAEMEQSQAEFEGLRKLLEALEKKKQDEETEYRRVKAEILELYRMHLGAAKDLEKASKRLRRVIDPPLRLILANILARGFSKAKRTIFGIMLSMGPCGGSNHGEDTAKDEDAATADTLGSSPLQGSDSGGFAPDHFSSHHRHGSEIFSRQDSKTVILDSTNGDDNVSQ